MLEAIRVVFCLVLPFLTGALMAVCCWRGAGWPYRITVAGMAFPLGMVGVVVGYLLLDRVGMGLDFGWNLAVQGGFAIVLAGIAAWRWRGHSASRAGHALSGPSAWAGLPRWTRWLVVGVVAWLVVRWLGILVEVIHRPLYPWDAWYAYGMQAKAWFFHPELDALKNGWRWFEAQGPAWTAGGTRHPPGIALMQLWLLQGLGRYDDALMNLPWPIAMASAGVTLYGVLRMSGLSLLPALSVAAALMTLPILNAQAALAGYGDLWIALYLMIVLIGFVLARRFGPGCLWLSALALAGMLTVKETSLLWVPVLVLGALAGRVRLRWLLVAGAAGGLAFFALLWWLDDPIRISTLGRLGFADGRFVFPDKIGLDAWREITMWPALLRHMFVYDNWHLFWYLAPFFSALALWYARFDRALVTVVVVALGGLFVLLGFFSLSTMGEAVVSGTSVNRLLLHLVPAFALMAGLVAAQVQPVRLRMDAR